MFLFGLCFLIVHFSMNLDGTDLYYRAVVAPRDRIVTYFLLKIAFLYIFGMFP